MVEVKTRLEGVIEATGAVGAMPDPDRLTVCGLPVALSVKLRVPVLTPVAVGVKLTLTVQLAVAANVAPQVVVLE